MSRPILSTAGSVNQTLPSGPDRRVTPMNQGSLASMKSRSIPVFTVGVGAERFARDIQVTRVEIAL